MCHTDTCAWRVVTEHVCGVHQSETETFPHTTVLGHADRIYQHVWHADRAYRPCAKGTPCDCNIPTSCPLACSSPWVSTATTASDTDTAYICASAVPSVAQSHVRHALPDRTPWLSPCFHPSHHVWSSRQNACHDRCGARAAHLVDRCGRVWRGNGCDGGITGRNSSMWSNVTP